MTGYELDGLSSISGTDRDFSLQHSIQTGSVAQSASYPISIVGLITGDIFTEV
jgi:hypothetical protein